MTNGLITLYSTLASTTTNFLFKRMPIDYFLMILIFTNVAAFTGIKIQNWIKQKTGKNMYSMMGYNFQIFACLLTVVCYQSYILKEKIKDGYDIQKAYHWC